MIQCTDREWSGDGLCGHSITLWCDYYFQALKPSMVAGIHASLSMLLTRVCMCVWHCIASGQC